MRNLLRVRTVGVGILVFVTMAVAYQLTLAPSVTFIDSGELATVASVMGIAHPTGYPLFTLLARVVAMLPLGADEIARLNVFASMLTALAVAVVFGLTLIVSSSTGRSRRTAHAADSKSWMELGVAAAGALVVGTSTTVWAQSVAIEVYALHLLLVTLLLASFMAGLREQQRNTGRIARGLVLASFFLGLAFSNHLTTLLVLPAMAYLYASSLSLGKASLIRLLRLVPWFFLGLSPYVYLLVRSPSGPPLDWGHPSTIGRFLWHVSGKQYRSWIFSGFESASRQLEYFVNRVPEEFSWITLLLAGAGFLLLWRRNRRRFWFLAILFVSCVGYAINYDIHDIDSYFLLAFVVLGVWAAFGMREIAMLVGARLPGFWRPIVLGACIALAVFQFFTHRAVVDQSDNYLVEDYTRTILHSVDSNAVVLSYQWDYFVSPSLYFQHVRGERGDVVIIDKELLRRSWYFDVLERNWPWLAARSRVSIDRFLVELRKFEYELPYRFDEIESSFNAMINDMIRASMVDRPVYVGPEIEPQFGVGLERVPAGLLFRLESPASGGRRVKRVPVVLRQTGYRDRLVDGLRYQCARMLVFQAFSLSKQDLHEDALRALAEASRFSPSMPEIARLRVEIEALAGKGAGPAGN